MHPILNPGLIDELLTASRPHLPKAKADQFRRLSIITPRDLLYHFPRNYEDRRRITHIADAADNTRQTFRGIISRVYNTHTGRAHRQNAKLFAIRDGEPDDREYINLTWWGQRHLASTIKAGDILIVHGPVNAPRRQAAIANPEFDIVENAAGRHQPVNTAGIIPVYPLTAGMTQDYLRQAIRQALADFRHCLHRSRPGRPPGELYQLLCDIHSPEHLDDPEEARYDLASDEVLEIQMALLNRRRHRELTTITPALAVDPAPREALLDRLPFRPTAAQRRCMDEIRQDLVQTGPSMNRLLQGEVGSGKTLVALAAAVDVAAAGQQTALLAPTALLAEQHFHTVCQLLDAAPSPMTGPGAYYTKLPGLQRPFTVALLTADTPARQRRQTLAAVKLGTIDLLAGTHAIIQPDIEIPRLQLAIADEQHRFGIAQRAALRQGAHYLMLTATPIPRTMQLTLYRDLDISIIDEMPVLKEPIRTVILAERQRRQAYDAIHKAVAAGQQAFVVCPYIDPSSDVDGQAVTDCYPALCAEFDDYRVRMIHGRMKPKDRDAELRAFRNGDTHILAATPIIEVGIDIPNATVMLIESAERFGLAQLHQMRGRVGRGRIPGACYIMVTPGLNPGSITRSRLRAIRDSNDGMTLAEADLEHRGYGDIAGTRQSGHGRILRAGFGYDLKMLERQRTSAERIHAADPFLNEPEHAELRAARQRALARMDAVPTDH